MQINKITKFDVYSDSGSEVTPGDVILIRVRDEDIVCRYEGVTRGYVVTQTLGDDSKTNRYRPASIKSLVLLNEWLWEKLRVGPMDKKMKQTITR